MTIEELEEFFKGRELPKEVQINRAVRITDVQLFLTTGIAQVKARGTTNPCYWHLLELREHLLKMDSGEMQEQ
ncbi:DUF6965 family protein [Desertivirga xinjiangensis]|uniref:DUF6965 family protein n=1 Tax=Desertivirga xinjiangensis TaxID=539206 RepID=UPI00210EAB21|nr:hypothetical protein [Pedobacter xinjiangensis]